MTSYELDSQLEPVLRQMEDHGIKIDVSFLSNLSEKIGLKLLKIESEAHSLIGHDFNLNSPSQLAKILYKDLKIDSRQAGIKRKKTHLSTGANDLEKIRHLHPIVDLILKYREFAKLKNTYLDPLPKLVDENGRLHTHYAIDTASGRLSSKSPNLQNIPKKGETGNEIRGAFISQPGYKLIVADYSQIELRIAAHFSGDTTMIKIFNEGKDIHGATAEELGVDRRTAKIVNFGILYGISSYGLAETLKITPEEAQMLIDKYFMTFSGLREYISKTIESVKEQGLTVGLLGRERIIPEINSESDRLRKFGERVAVNHIFQSSSADIIKLAMLELSKKLDKDTKMLLQIHDELVFEVKNTSINESVTIIREIMESVVKLKVPIIVNISAGEDWSNTREL